MAENAKNVFDQIHAPNFDADLQRIIEESIREEACRAAFIEATRAAFKETTREAVRESSKESFSDTSSKKPSVKSAIRSSAVSTTRSGTQTDTFFEKDDKEKKIFADDLAFAAGSEFTSVDSVHSAASHSSAAPRSTDVKNQDLDIELLRAIEDSAKEAMLNRKALSSSLSSLRTASPSPEPMSPTPLLISARAKSRNPAGSSLPKKEVEPVTSELLFDLAFSDASPRYSNSLSSHQHSNGRAHSNGIPHSAQDTKADVKDKAERNAKALLNVNNLLLECRDWNKRGQENLMALIDYQTSLGFLDEKLKFLVWLNKQELTTTRAKVREHLATELEEGFNVINQKAREILHTINAHNSDRLRLKQSGAGCIANIISETPEVLQLKLILDQLQKTMDELARRTSAVDAFLKTFKIPKALPGKPSIEELNAKSEGKRIVKSEQVIEREKALIKRMYDELWIHYQREQRHRVEAERRRIADERRAAVERRTADDRRAAEQHSTETEQRTPAEEPQRSTRAAAGNTSGVVGGQGQIQASLLHQHLMVSRQNGSLQNGSYDLDPSTISAQPVAGLGSPSSSSPSSQNGHSPLTSNPAKSKWGKGYVLGGSS